MLAGQALADTLTGKRACKKSYVAAPRRSAR